MNQIYKRVQFGLSFHSDNMLHQGDNYFVIEEVRTLGKAVGN